MNKKRQLIEGYEADRNTMSAEELIAVRERNAYKTDAELKAMEAKLGFDKDIDGRRVEVEKDDVVISRTTSHNSWGNTQDLYGKTEF